MEIDLCFVVDCTGSMASYIDATKKCITRVVDYMGRMEPKIKIRVGFCGYRDHCDGLRRIQTFPFTYSYTEFQNYVNNVSATGGGDAPEDVLGGLNAAINGATMSASFFMSPMLHHMVVFTLVCPTTIREAIRKV